LDDIRSAAQRLRGVAVRTPMLHSRYWSELTGADVNLKAECLQRTGSFKVRGATNMIALLTPAERARGVIAVSAGNHAQGAAVAASSHHTIADGIAVSTPGAVPLAYILRLVDEIVTVDEEAITGAMVALLERAKLVVEGAGAVGLAALAARAVQPRGGKVVV